MSFEIFLHYATLWTLIATAISVTIAVVSQRRQVNTTVYLELTGRLHSLYRAIPAEMRIAHLSGADLESAYGDQAAVVTFDFAQLIASAFALYQNGYFSGKLWKLLSHDAERGLRLAVFRATWPKLRPAFSYNPAFIDYVESVQERSN